MKNLILILFVLLIISMKSCCACADCSGYELSFTFRFITQENDYYYFDESEVVDLKAFYQDSIFIDVYNQESGPDSSRVVTVFFTPDRIVNNYTILANDTLLGNLNLEYGMVENNCCGPSLEIMKYSFESDQKFKTDFGLQIIIE